VRLAGSKSLDVTKVITKLGGADKDITYRNI